jgi:hypothetical protein
MGYVLEGSLRKAGSLPPAVSSAYAGNTPEAQRLSVTW